MKISFNSFKKLLKSPLRKCKHFVLSHYKISNYYNTNFNQCILICYIIEPFVKMPNHIFHLNYLEALEIAKVFSHLHYNVDVVDYKYKGTVDYSKYSVIFGFGKVFDDSQDCMSPTQTRIFYATEASPDFAITEEKKRLDYFYLRHGISFPLERDLGRTFSESSLSKCNAIFSVGNYYIAHTYEYLNKNIHLVSVSGLHFFEPKNMSDKTLMEKTKNNFLWFGGVGSIHKGLDICLETFSKIPHAHLYIAGPVRNEFFEIYKNEFALDNIHYLGILNTQSNEFQDICNKCVFSILPSCSEACSTAVITTMYMGLIPVVTSGTGIDIDPFGYLIESVNIEDMIPFINHLCTINTNKLMEQSNEACNYSRNSHSLASFSVTMETAIMSVLGLKK